MSGGNSFPRDPLIQRIAVLKVLPFLKVASSSYITSCSVTFPTLCFIMVGYTSTDGGFLQRQRWSSVGRVETASLRLMDKGGTTPEITCRAVRSESRRGDTQSKSPLDCMGEGDGQILLQPGASLSKIAQDT